MGIAYALGSLVFAGLNDFLFKLYIRAPKRRLGPFVALTGAVWAAFFLVLMNFSWRLNSHGLCLSLAAGLTSVVGNILLIESMRLLPVGVCSTAYRLNLALVVVLAAVWLHEPLPGLKLLGVGLAISAVLLLYEPANGARNFRHARLAYLLLLAATSCRAVMGIVYKIAMDHKVLQYDFLCVSGLCWLVGGTLYALLQRQKLVPSRAAVGFGVGSGLAIVGIVWFLSQATRFGQASIVVPVAQLSFVVTVILGMIFLREKLTLRKASAVALACGCVVVLTLV